MAEPALAARDIAFAIKGRSLVRGVSLELQPGAVVGILGPNGAGKSTLLRIMAGLLQPDAGEVTLLNRDLRSWTLRQRARHIGYLPQHFSPHWNYKVRALLAMGLDRAGVVGDISQLAEGHGMAALLDRDWYSLSGGERGRVLAAAVLAPHPSVVLADEPAAALDIGQAEALMERLRHQAREGAAVALVTHDLNQAGRWCDRLLVMSSSSMVLEGTTRDVLHSRILDETFGVEFERSLGASSTLSLFPAKPGGLG